MRQSKVSDEVDEVDLRRASASDEQKQDRNSPSSVIRLAGDAGCHLPPRGKALGEHRPLVAAACSRGALNVRRYSAPIVTSD